MPPATVVALVAMLIVSTTPLAVPVVLPIAIVRAAAGFMLPNEILLTRVLLPSDKDAVPAVPTPDKMLTEVAAAVAEFSMLIVSPAVDWPNVSELVLVVEPILIELLLVVPMLIEPLVVAWNDNVEPPWISVVLVLVLPIVSALARVLPIFITPVVPLVTEPVSIVIAPELPLALELPDAIVSAPLAAVALPEASVSVPLAEAVPAALPERNVTAADGVEAAD